jgi:hypothetical protein
MTEVGLDGSAGRYGPADPRQTSQTPTLENNSKTRLAIAIMTRNRKKPLFKTLYKLSALEDEYPLVLVDNASDDNTVKMARKRDPVPGWLEKQLQLKEIKRGDC